MVKITYSAKPTQYTQIYNRELNMTKRIDYLIY